MKIRSIWLELIKNIRHIRQKAVRSLASNLRAKVAFGVIFPMVVVLLLFSLYEFSRDRSAMLRELSIVASETGNIIEATVRHEMLESDFEGIERILETFYSSGSFENLYILDTSGKIIFSPFKEGLGNQISNQLEECQPCHRLPVGERPNSIVLKKEDGNYVFRSMKPIYNGPECIECHDESEPIRGLLLNDITIEPYTNILLTNLSEQIFKGGTIIFLSVFIVYFSLNRFVLHGIDDLAGAMSKFAEGDSPSHSLNSRIDEIGQLAKAFDNMANDVESRYKENVELSEKLQTQSVLRGQLLNRLIDLQENERKRVARDIHDELGQALSGLSLKSQLISNLMKTDISQADHELRKMGVMIQGTTDKMYDLIKDLRPSILDDLGLVPAIKDYATRALEDTNIKFSIQSIEMAHRLPKEKEVTIYRVFQEALHNTIKHSGADEVFVKLSEVDGLLILSVKDNGVGFDAEEIKMQPETNENFGLLGMQERVTLCGGTLDITSSKSAGTILEVSIPFEEDRNA